MKPNEKTYLRYSGGIVRAVPARVCGGKGSTEEAEGKVYMKTRIIAAALAAFFMLPFLGSAAFAAELDISEATIAEEYANDPAESPDAETEDAPEMDIDFDDMAALLSLFMLMGMMNGDAPTVELPALPPGTASVIDYNTDPDGRLFYTIMTPDEHVFYLVIDKNSSTNNVYFLNAVTIADLAALADFPLPTQGGTVTVPTPAPGEPGQPTETPTPPGEDEQPQGGGNTGMIIFIVIIAVVGGGAGWYFKIYRPKQQGAASGEEYDPSMDEAENDYTADWGDDSDGDTYEEESGDGEDD